MLYEFRSRATGSVTMVGKAAEQVLKIIGKIGRASCRERV